MKYTVISTPAFLKRIKRLNKDHKNRLKKFIERLEKEGMHALKILAAQGAYILGEMKSARPPYRLYVLYDQLERIFYILSWEHKNKQKKIIKDLTNKLKTGIDVSIDYIFGES